MPRLRRLRELLDSHNLSYHPMEFYLPVRYRWPSNGDVLVYLLNFLLLIDIADLEEGTILMP
jgi:hypothetical protein